jgi:hypothetical protein
MLAARKIAQIGTLMISVDELEARHAQNEGNGAGQISGERVAVPPLANNAGAAAAPLFFLLDRFYAHA